MSPRKKVVLTQSETEYLDTIASVTKTNGKYFCPNCKDKGFVIAENDDNEIAEICPCQITKLWNKVFIEAGVSIEFFDKTIETDWNLQQDAYGNDLGANKKRKQKIGEFMANYVKNIPILNAGYKFTINRKNKSPLKINSLLLVGGNKSGKSLLAAIAIQETLKKGLSAKMFDWLELRKLMHEYNKKEEQEEIMQDFSNKALIVIDNVQNVKRSNDNSVNQMADFAILEFERLCRRRIASGKPTIITSDSTYPEINAGNNWQNLIESCYTIQLPSPVAPESKF
jgi:DNA replication protein DnaC